MNKNDADDDFWGVGNNDNGKLFINNILTLDAFNN